ncbi:sensor histidine kinase, partial [Streptococcus anginosus]
LMILIWRVYRRNRTIQLGFILDELHYISQGNYNHKISTKHMNSMEPVVSSINRLVDSTVKAMEEERRIEESKDELIANMSHDIRTPLTSVIGYLGLIENKQI